MTKTEEEKIALWKKREQQAKAKWQEMEAGKKHKEGKKDNQRKFLLGAAVLEGLKKGGNPAAEAIRASLDDFLTRDHERALFELAPLSESEKERRKAARARRISASPRSVPEKENETKPTETA
jgi:hypothetical protein